MAQSPIDVLRTPNFACLPAGAGEHWVRGTTHLGRFVLRKKGWAALAGKVLLPTKTLYSQVRRLEGLVRKCQGLLA